MWDAVRITTSNTGILVVKIKEQTEYVGMMFLMTAFNTALSNVHFQPASSLQSDFFRKWPLTPDLYLSFGWYFSFHAW
jgi:hypothetical protein